MLPDRGDGWQRDDHIGTTWARPTTKAGTHAIETMAVITPVPIITKRLLTHRTLPCRFTYTRAVGARTVVEAAKT